MESQLSATFIILPVLTTWLSLTEVGAEHSAPMFSASSSHFSKQGVVHRPGYRRFFANDSLIGRLIPCTHAQKVCFRYNLLFNPDEQKCQEMVQGSCDFRINKTEFELGSGYVVGSCRQYTDPCPGYRMAWDGRCYRAKIARDAICGADARLVPHLFDGFECRSASAGPVHVEQPSEEGCCRIPDLRFPDDSRFSSVIDLPADLNCSDEQQNCFSKGEVWVPVGSGCFPLHERGPCGEEDVLVLDGAAAGEGRARSRCAHVRDGCPSGQKRMTFDGRCHDDRDLELLAPYGVARTAFGQYEVKVDDSEVTLQSTPSTPNVCQINTIFISKEIGGLGRNSFPSPHCGVNDKNMCVLYEIEDSAPDPEPE